MGHMKQRLALWALGQALPDASTFQSHIREALLGVMLACVAGVLLALSFACGLYLAYLAIIQQGVSPMVTLAFLMAAGLLIATLSFLLARRLIAKSTNITEDLSLFSREDSKDALTDTFQILAKNFFSGFMEPPATPSRHSIVTELERELEALKEQVSELAEETIETVKKSNGASHPSVH